MGALGVAGSSLSCFNTTFAGIKPAYPFSLGFWWYITSLASNQTIWTTALSSAVTEFHETYQDSTGHFVTRVGSNFTATATAGSVSRWYYVISRYISATNRRTTVLLPLESTVDEAQNVTSNTPASTFDRECILCQLQSSPGFASGIVAEMWRTDTDIQADGAALLLPTLFQLAYKGPWSISSIAERIVWYKSLRQSIADTSDTIDDPSFARNGRAGWGTLANNLLQAPHPPLASDYVYLNTLKQKLTP
jgi:hypothetical protein